MDRSPGLPNVFARLCSLDSAIIEGVVEVPSRRFPLDGKAAKLPLLPVAEKDFEPVLLLREKRLYLRMKGATLQ